MEAKLEKLIDTYLAERRESVGGGWAKVTDEDLNQFGKIIQALIEEKFEADADGDFPINYMIVDRNRAYFPGFAAVSYDHKNPDGHFEDVMHNLSVAVENANIAYNLRRYRKK